jgi:biotin-(acetyl-CoA carboxylase) ligase
VECPGRPDLAGRAVDVDEDGALIVLDAAGRRHRVLVGDVRHLR